MKKNRFEESTRESIVVDFLKLKNEIVREATTRDLIKDHNIEYVKPYLLSEKSPTSLNRLNAGICPYCIMYCDSVNNCEKCPLAKANDVCSKPSSTWRRANDIWISRQTYKSKKDLRLLIKEYNERIRELFTEDELKATLYKDVSCEMRGYFYN